MDREHLERLRAPLAREIRLITNVLYVATAACMAVAANDLANHDIQSAIGNIGLLLVLLRIYLTAPKCMAMARHGSRRWIKAEEDFLHEHFPWCDAMGKAGWICLFVSVALQLSAIAG